MRSFLPNCERGSEIGSDSFALRWIEEELSIDTNGPKSGGNGRNQEIEAVPSGVGIILFWTKTFLRFKVLKKLKNPRFYIRISKYNNYIECQKKRININRVFTQLNPQGITIT